MGIRYDHHNGFDGQRRWTFDVDELLTHLCYLGATVAAVLFAANLLGAGRG